VALVIGFKPAAARAAVRVEFYSHPSGLTPKLYYYSPHAFIAVKPEGESAVLKAPDTFGYETRDAYGAVIGGHAKGEVAKADPHFLPISKLHFWVVISDEQYLALTRGIAAWDSFPGHPYSLKTRNCLTFEAEMARLVGLVAPPPASLDPSRYLEDIKAANRDRVEIPGEQRAGGPRIAGSGAQ
jgi:hypothetical protein